MVYALRTAHKKGKNVPVYMDLSLFNELVKGSQDEVLSRYVNLSEKKMDRLRFTNSFIILYVSYISDNIIMS